MAPPEKRCPLIPYLYLIAAASLMLLLVFVPGITPLKVGILSLAGCTVSFADLFMNGLFRLYTYKPGLLADPYKDNHLGVLIAEYLFVPAGYALMAYLPPRLRFWYTLLITLSVTCLEVLFLRLRVYEQDGWRILFTIGLFILYGTVISTWANRLDGQGYTRLNRLLQLASAFLFVVNSWGMAAQAVGGLASPHAGWLANPDRDLMLSGLVLEALPVYLTSVTTLIYRWTRPGHLIALTAAMTIWLSILRWRGLWIVHPPWSPLLEAVVCTLLVWLISRLDPWFERKLRNRAATS